MLANGFTAGAILDAIAGVNASLAPKSRITDDSLHRHRHRHFPVQAGASSVWRQLMEQRAQTEAATFQEGVTSLLTPRLFFEVMMTKGFAGLTDEAAEVGPEMGLAAAKELARLGDRQDDEQKWARAHAQMARILEAYRLLPDGYRQQVLAVAEGRTPPPPGGARLAVIEGGVVTDDDFDSGDDDDDLDD
jgi:hypothetical protein